MKRVVLYARSPEWQRAIERAGELVGGPHFHIIKSEGRTLAGFLDVPGTGRAFLKRADAPTWWSGILDRFRGSRASRALNGVAMLTAAGFSHAAPFAAMNVRRAGAVRESFLLSEPLERGDTLSRFALGPGGIKGRSDLRRRKRILDTVAREVRRLHDANLYTRDMQETNLMVEDHADGSDAGGFRVYFLDLEDFRSARSVSWQRRMLNLVHLDRSVGRFLSRASRLDFLYTYLGGKPDRTSARRMVSEILAIRGGVERPRARIEANVSAAVPDTGKTRASATRSVPRNVRDRR
ncbi:MAG TPA: lipopolysaccharide kinase InaA family protein [Candidatus Binataceae bacterium]